MVKPRPGAPEGWGVIRPGDRKAHYYRDQFSLCGRVGFYRGPLDISGGYSPDDCAACFRKLAKEALRHADTPHHPPQGPPVEATP